MAVAKKTVKKENLPLNTGRRKTSVSRVKVIPNGKGLITINDRELTTYFVLGTMQQIVKQPLVLTGLDGKVDISVNVYGGGLTGQAYSIRHGISRGLVKMDEAYKIELKKAGFLTRDSRMKERKKYGLKKARKSPQFSKR